MNDQRNLFLAIGLSIAIIVGFQFLFPPPPPEEPAGQTATPAAPGGAPVPSGRAQSSDAPRPAVPGTDLPAAPGTATDPMGRDALLAHSKRVRIETPRLTGSIALAGGAIDDLTLVGYRTAVDPASADVDLLSPGTDKGAYWADFGWVQGAGRRLAMPGRDTVWRADTKTLRPDNPVTLSWDNGQGLRFFRRYAIDENYMFTITQRIENTGAAATTVLPYGLISRYGLPETSEFTILHEGPLGVFRESADTPSLFEDYTYDEVSDAAEDPRLGINVIQTESIGGWIGFGDHYWLVALVPGQKSKMTARFFYKAEGEKYQTDFLGSAQSVAPGGTVEVTSRLFAGAKELGILEAYEKNLAIEKFNLAIDFGWVWFLAKPLFELLHYLNGWVGNFGVSILIMTLMIKIVFFPLANKSYRSMGKMKKLQPEMLKIRERYKDDKARINQEMMGLYKKEKVNPASGCLPMVIQIPVFIALYQLLFATIEMRHAPFFWWIRDLSVPDPTNFVNLFGLLPFSPEGFIPDFLLIGIWPLIMGLSMFLQQKLNPTPPDPIQAKIFMFLPIIFTFMLARFPSGLVIYWAWNNVLSIGQQWLIMKRAGAFDTKSAQAKT